MDRVELLRRIPLFEELTGEDADILAGGFHEQEFAAGQVIFNQGDAGSEMYIVASGHVNIFLPGEESRRVSLKDLTVGEYFGELSPFDMKPRSASALATTDVVLFGLTAATISGYLARRPHAALVILGTLAERLRETNALLSQRAAKNVVEEFDKNLKWSDRLADRVAELNGSWAFIVGLMLLTVGWTIANVLWSEKSFDPYPFVFYNLVLAILVALQGPLIVMSQNRQTLKDRAQSETDFQVNLKNEVNIETIIRELHEFRDEVNTRFERRDARRE